MSNHVIEISNIQYLKLESLYTKMLCEENADRDWSIDAVQKASKAFYQYCNDLGVSADIGQKLACYVNSNAEYIYQLAEAEKKCAAQSATDS